MPIRAKKYGGNMKDKNKNSQYNVYLNLQKENEENDENIKLDYFPMPIPNEGNHFQYNGILYLVKKVTYHYKEGFKPYIELFLIEW